MTSVVKMTRGGGSGTVTALVDGKDRDRAIQIQASTQDDEIREQPERLDDSPMQLKEAVSRSMISPQSQVNSNFDIISPGIDRQGMMALHTPEARKTLQNPGSKWGNTKTADQETNVLVEERCCSSNINAIEVTGLFLDQ